MNKTSATQLTTEYNSERYKSLLGAKKTGDTLASNARVENRVKVSK